MLHAPFFRLHQGSSTCGPQLVPGGPQNICVIFYNDRLSPSIHILRTVAEYSRSTSSQLERVDLLFSAKRFGVEGKKRSTE